MPSAPMRERDRASARQRASAPWRSAGDQTTGGDSIRLVVKGPGGVILLPLHEIECLKADGNVVVVHTMDGERHRIRESLSRIHDQLQGHGFIRVHRGTIVRASAIVAIEKGRYRKAFAVLRMGAKFEIGRVEFQRLRPLWHPGMLDLHALSTGLHLLPSTD
jgi:DNA-binding LytR/AlgR family response regulator